MIICKICGRKNIRAYILHRTMTSPWFKKENVCAVCIKWAGRIRRGKA